MCAPQEGQAAITAKLRAYRPSATVLEADMAPARRGEGAGCVAGPGMTASRSPHEFLEVMRLKRSVHDKAIKARTGPVFIVRALLDIRLVMGAIGWLMPLWPSVGLVWSLLCAMSQMSKQELDNRIGMVGAGEGGAGGQSDRAGLRAAAAEAAVHGDADQSRFRDAECFVPTSREGRHEEEGFSVHRGGVDAMSGAVMDLMDDETVRTPVPHAVPRGS